MSCKECGDETGSILSGMCPRCHPDYIADYIGRWEIEDDGVRDSSMAWPYRTGSGAMRLL